MQPWLAAHAWKHLSMTSVTRWEVSTLPPTTAAVADGLRRDASGIRISTGARHPLKKIGEFALLRSSSWIALVCPSSAAMYSAVDPCKKRLSGLAPADQHAYHPQMAGAQPGEARGA